MTSTVRFWDAVEFTPHQPKSSLQSWLERADRCFYFGGALGEKKVYVVPEHLIKGREGVVPIEELEPHLLTAKKVIILAIVWIPALIAKVVLRSIYRFHLIDLQQKLKEGMNISEHQLVSDQKLLSKILAGQSDSRVEYHSGRFCLKEMPHLMFEMFPAGASRGDRADGLYGNELTRRDFAELIQAEAVRMVYQLDQLVIPRAQLFEITVGNRAVTVMVQQSHHCSDVNSQEQRYREGLSDKTVEQITTFIVKTGFNRATWRNMPRLDDGRIAFIDLSSTRKKEVEKGLFSGEEECRDLSPHEAQCFSGWHECRSLISCLFPEEQMNLVRDTACRNGVVVQPAVFEAAKNRRLEAIRYDEQLEEFYKKKRIIDHPLTNIQVDDLSSLELNLTETGVTKKKFNSETKHVEKNGSYLTSLEQATQDVIFVINKIIEHNKDRVSTKGKRFINLELRYGPLEDYDAIVTSGQTCSWLRRIIDALVAKKHLFKLIKVTKDRYLIQA